LEDGLVIQGGAGGEGWQLFGGWSSIGHIALQAGIFYLIIVAALRIAGQRALAKMSGYDMIVTVALGSLVANIATATEVTVADGFAAVVTFLVLQQLTSWLQARSKAVHHAVRQRPQVVLWNGRFIEDRLSKASVTEDEVRAAIRRTGMLSVSDVQCVVLENDGEWSVIGRSDARDLSALEGLSLPYELPVGGDPADWRDDRRDSKGGRDRGSDRPAARHVERAADGHRGNSAPTGPV
jgi:uncharacterized membrane protein YcaP (DUF421 family)